jgi:hypothetical protein
MSESTVILAFDIGIRNLAWCLMEGRPAAAGEQPFRHLRGWQNYDLLAGAGHETPKEKLRCSGCSVAAGYWNAVAGPAAPTCARHCPATHPPLKDLSGNVLKRLPALAVLRQLVGPTAKKTMSKAAAVAALQQRASLPLEKVKLKKAVEHELTTLHDAIRRFVTANAELFRGATQILLENQPVLKNPTMKSVQILLFATLRDVLQPAPPPLKLVHAGKKVKVEGTGDAAYKSRKDASEARVRALLPKVAGAANWQATFEAAGKKSDLADAFCMCWDALGALGA